MQELTTQNSKYKIENLIGSGQYGEVYKGINKDTNQEVAIKILYNSRIQSIATQGTEKQYHQQNLDYYYNQIVREIQILSQISSDYVIRLYEYFQDSNAIYLILELCEGNLAKQILSSTDQNNQITGLSEKQAKHYFVDILRGMLEINQKEIIHRDLKPENILINKDQLKICDFGFANQVQNTEKKQYYTILGTQGYMAPEIDEQDQYNYKVDIWSLGCILFYMLFGRLPFGKGLFKEQIKVQFVKYTKNQNFDVVEILQKQIFSNRELQQTLVQKAQNLTVECKDLLTQLLKYDADHRIDLQALYDHKAFLDLDSNDKEYLNRESLSMMVVIKKLTKSLEDSQPKQNSNENPNLQRQNKLDGDYNEPEMEVDEELKEINTKTQYLNVNNNNNDEDFTFRNSNLSSGGSKQSSMPQTPKLNSIEDGDVPIEYGGQKISKVQIDNQSCVSLQNQLFRFDSMSEQGDSTVITQNVQNQHFNSNNLHSGEKSVQNSTATANFQDIQQSQQHNNNVPTMADIYGSQSIIQSQNLSFAVANKQGQFQQKQSTDLNLLKSLVRVKPDYDSNDLVRFKEQLSIFQYEMNKYKFIYDFIEDTQFMYSQKNMLKHTNLLIYGLQKMYTFLVKDFYGAMQKEWNILNVKDFDAFKVSTCYLKLKECTNQELQQAENSLQKLHFLAMDDIYNDSDLSKYGLINNKDVLNFVTQNIVETNYSQIKQPLKLIINCECKDYIQLNSKEDRVKIKLGLQLILTRVYDNTFDFGLYKELLRSFDKVYGKNNKIERDNFWLFFNEWLKSGRKDTLWEQIERTKSKFFSQ